MSWTFVDFTFFFKKKKRKRKIKKEKNTEKNKKHSGIQYHPEFDSRVRVKLNYSIFSRRFGK
jgi:hypothetical protein